ncbi:polysaccharide deacetylase family protein [Hydrogenimonas sp.]
MKNTLILSIYFLTYWLGINKLFYFLNRLNQRVLTYHNIIPEQYYDETLLHLGVSHSSEIFERHIRFIQSRLEITTEIGKEKSCLITFDDGFENNYSEAHNVLKRFKAHAFFFVPIDMVLHDNVLWIDKILMWFSYVPEGKYHIANVDIEISDNNSRQESFLKIWNLLLTNYHLKEIALENMDNSFAFTSLNIDSELYTKRFSGMCLEDIEEMKAYGHKIGCHSVYHDILACLDDEQLKNDTELSETYLDKLYNTKIYSYPFGGEKEVSQKVIEKIAQSKFSYAVLNISKPDYPYGRYALPRFALPNSDNRYILDAKLSGLEYFIKYRKLLPNIKEYMNESVRS